MEKLISVIIPAYNAENTIEKCINSIKADDVEIIVVIDGATDKTEEVCKMINNKNLKIIKQENKGAYEARKNGIQNAKGKYIMFLDSDDTYTKNTIVRIKEIILKNPKLDLIRFRYKKYPDGYEQFKYFEENEKLVLKKDFQQEVYPMFLNSYMLNALWTNCIKKEVFNRFSISHSNIKYGEDLILNLEIFSNIDNALFLEDVLYNYNYRSDSITNTPEKNKIYGKLEDTINVYSKLYTYLVKWNMTNESNLKIIDERLLKETKVIIELLKQ